MPTLTIEADGRVFRWAGGSFIAVWRAERSGEAVPDDMISLPESLNRSKATQDDFRQIVEACR